MTHVLASEETFESPGPVICEGGYNEFIGYGDEDNCVIDCSCYKTKRCVAFHCSFYAIFGGLDVGSYKAKAGRHSTTECNNPQHAK